MEPVRVVLNHEYELLLNTINQYHATAIKIEDCAGQTAAERMYERCAGMVDAFRIIYTDLRGEARLEYDKQLHVYNAVPVTR